MSNHAALFGCTAQFVSESAPHANSELLETERRVLKASFQRSECHSNFLQDLGELGVPRREGCLWCIGESSAPYPVLCSGSRFRAKPSPCGSASFCFAHGAPSGSRFLPEQV
jgi:hypothetical protein